MLHQHNRLTRGDIHEIFNDSNEWVLSETVNQIYLYAEWLGRQKIRRAEKSRQLAAKIGNMLAPSDTSVLVSSRIASRFHELNRNSSRTLPR